MANRLSSIQMAGGDYKNSLIVASEAISRAEKAGELSDTRKITMLWNVSQCQLMLGLISDWEQVSSIVYDAIREEVRQNGWHTSDKLLVFTTTTTGAYIDRGEFAKAAYWQSRSE